MKFGLLIITAFVGGLILGCYIGFKIISGIYLEKLEIIENVSFTKDFCGYIQCLDEIVGPVCSLLFSVSIITLLLILLSSIMLKNDSKIPIIVLYLISGILCGSVLGGIIATNLLENIELSLGISMSGNETISGVKYVYKTLRDDPFLVYKSLVKVLSYIFR
ncbi:hypothetical protein DRP04_02515 [Archaeoglobales archaeon]|nr:MAG: hypothetical protein DRP04_02515 [Archaeoglobales archaeon]